MDWFKRDKSDMYVYAPDECPKYSETSDLFTIKMYHGGMFNSAFFMYTGGKVDYFYCCDVDKLSVLELSTMYGECGEKGCITEFWYKHPNEPIESGLRPLDTDMDVLGMCSLVPGTQYVEVFVVAMKPLSVDNLPLKVTPSKPTPDKHIVLDDSGDDCDSDERVRRDRNLVDQILEMEGISKTFSATEREKAEDRRRTSVRKKKSRGKKPTSALVVEDGDAGSWHDDDSNKDMSDIEGDFDPFRTGNEFNEHDHADRQNETVENENVPNVEGSPARDGGNDTHGSADGENRGHEDTRHDSDHGSGDAGAFPDSDPDYNSGDEKMAVSSDDEIDTRYPEFNEKIDMVAPTFELGMIFSSASILRQAIRTHAIIDRRPIITTHNY